MGDKQKQECLAFAKKLALEAGEIMKKYFLSTNTTWKEDKTPLTQADTEINDLVLEKIRVAYPTYSIWSEEESDIKESRYTWVCDPVDGTAPYAHGLPISTFSLALCFDGVPQTGVVFDPFMNRMYSAVVGGGAYCNEARLNVSDKGFENGLIDIEGWFYTGRVLETDPSFFKALAQKGAKPLSVWASVLQGALVAEGKYIGVVCNGWAPQDPAAIKVIIEEAGGKLTSLDGDEQRYDRKVRGFIASNGKIHDELVQMVKEATV